MDMGSERRSHPHSREGTSTLNTPDMGYGARHYAPRPLRSKKVCLHHTPVRSTLGAILRGMSAHHTRNILSSSPSPFPSQALEYYSLAPPSILVGFLARIPWMYHATCIGYLGGLSNTARLPCFQLSGLPLL
ncbi:hypothetical protein AB1N83_011282 [Pleurotus pulmonarius]